MKKNTHSFLQPRQTGNAAVWVILAVVVVAAVGVGWYLATRETTNTNTANVSTNRTVNTNRTANANTPINSGSFQINTNRSTANVNASANTNAAGNTNAVVNTNTAENTNTAAAAAFTMTASGVNPASVTVAAGTTVTWKNESGRTVYIEPNDHPSHTKYAGVWDDDGTGQIANGQTYSFTFTQTGTYGWHNHLNTSVTGTVIVR